MQLASLKKCEWLNHKDAHVMSWSLEVSINHADYFKPAYVQAARLLWELLYCSDL